MKTKTKTLTLQMLKSKFVSAIKYSSYYRYWQKWSNFLEATLDDKGKVSGKNYLFVFINVNRGIEFNNKQQNK